MVNKLSNKWTLWYHGINDNNWKLSNYTKILSYNDLETYINLYRTIDNFSAGMFFLMKDKILPLWEVKENKSGGYWSFKITKNKINSVWKDICSQIIGNTILNVDKMIYVNGVSLSPKINNCIIKIWLNKKIDISEFNIDNPDVNVSDSRYVKHNH